MTFHLVVPVVLLMIGVVFLFGSPFWGLLWGLPFIALGVILLLMWIVLPHPKPNPLDPTTWPDGSPRIPDGSDVMLATLPGIDWLFLAACASLPLTLLVGWLLWRYVILEAIRVEAGTRDDFTVVGVAVDLFWRLQQFLATARIRLTAKVLGVPVDRVEPTGRRPGMLLPSEETRGLRPPKTFTPEAPPRAGGTGSSATQWFDLVNKNRQEDAARVPDVLLPSEEAWPRGEERRLAADRAKPINPQERMGAVRYKPRPKEHL